MSRKAAQHGAGLRDGQSGGEGGGGGGGPEIQTGLPEQWGGKGHHSHLHQSEWARLVQTEMEIG